MFASGQQHFLCLAAVWCALDRIEVETNTAVQPGGGDAAIDGGGGMAEFC